MNRDCFASLAMTVLSRICHARLKLHLFTVGTATLCHTPPSSPPYKTVTSTKPVGTGVIAYQICSYAFFIISPVFNNFTDFLNFHYTTTIQILHTVFNGGLVPAVFDFGSEGRS